MKVELKKIKKGPRRGSNPQPQIGMGRIILTLAYTPVVHVGSVAIELLGNIASEGSVVESR